MTHFSIQGGRSGQPIVIRIRELRRQRALTQEELAEALGVSRQSVNAMEAGRCLPSLPVAFQIADFFSVPLHTIFGVEKAELSEESAQSSPLSLTSPRKEVPMAQLVPWSPLREMREMLDEMMDDVTGWTAPVAISAPAVNVSQTENEVQVEMRLPGYTKEDLNLEIGDGYLTISGEVTQEKEEKPEGGKQYYRREFVQQNFSRTVSLPVPVQADKAKAEMKDGILHVTLPKEVEEKPKTTRLVISS